MLRHKRNRYRQLYFFAVVDMVAVILGLWIAYLLRFRSGVVDVTKAYSPESYLRALPLAVVVWIFWLDNSGCYNFRERAFNLQIMKKIVRANALSVITIVAIHFFQRSLEFSRLIYLTSFVTSTLCVGLGRLVLDRGLAYLRRIGAIQSARVAILGTGTLAETLANRIRNHTLLGLSVVGFISANEDDVGKELAGFPIIGDFESIRDALMAHRIDEVIVTDPDLSPARILEFIVECEKEIVSIRVVPNLLEAMLVEMSVEQIDGIPLFGLKETPLQGWNVILKRVFDVVASLLILVLGSPVFAVLALLVKVTSHGPVLYRQERIGIDGRRFNMLKFRSMTVDAESETGPVWAKPGDNRVTPVGRFMRRFNLDELPQIFNVLRGDMSLVGPRPERPYFVREFREAVPRYMTRHRVKSGMTGWAQVNGLRGNTSIDERIKYDLYYIENWSIWFDLKILVMTVGAHENAY